MWLDYRINRVACEIKVLNPIISMHISWRLTALEFSFSIVHIRSIYYYWILQYLITEGFISSSSSKHNLKSNHIIYHIQGLVRFPEEILVTLYRMINWIPEEILLQARGIGTANMLSWGLHLMNHQTDVSLPIGKELYFWNRWDTHCAEDINHEGRCDLAQISGVWYVHHCAEDINHERRCGSWNFMHSR